MPVYSRTEACPDATLGVEVAGGKSMMSRAGPELVATVAVAPAVVAGASLGRGWRVRTIGPRSANVSAGRSGVSDFGLASPVGMRMMLGVVSGAVDEDEALASAPLAGLSVDVPR